MANLTTLSVSQSIQHRILGGLVNNELEMILKEVVVACFRHYYDICLQGLIYHATPQSGYPVFGRKFALGT